MSGTTSEARGPAMLSTWPTCAWAAHVEAGPSPCRTKSISISPPARSMRRGVYSRMVGRRPSRLKSRLSSTAGSSAEQANISLTWSSLPTLAKPCSSGPPRVMRRMRGVRSVTRSTFRRRCLISWLTR
ncbi:hypothetical protein D9M71_680210 [compost metagenome]